MKRPTLPLSIDWEDWFQLCCPPFDEDGVLDRFEDRLARATDLALGLCEDLGAEATWFCLADQAKRHPELLRRIAGSGHRIGLHGLTHRRACDMDLAEFHTSVRSGRRLLEDLSGTAVTSYRAPDWSLRGPAEEWWKELPELGIRIDSSRAPLGILGDPNWSRQAGKLGDGLWELPPPVAGVGALTVPLWGWSLRILPGAWLRQRILALAEAGLGTPLVLHPWELDEGQPSLPLGTPLGHRFAHSAGLRGHRARLRTLWAGLRLVSLEAWVEEQEARQ